MSGAEDKTEVPLQHWRLSGGYPWWIVFLDFQKRAQDTYGRGTISIVSDFGNWGFVWGGIPPEEGIMKFLLSCDEGYLGGKLLLDDSRVYDHPATVAYVREEILTSRRAGHLTKKKAADEWALFQELKDDDSEFGFFRFYESSGFPDPGEFYCSKKASSDQLEMFFRECWPKVRESMQKILDGVQP